MDFNWKSFSLKCTQFVRTFPSGRVNCLIFRNFRSQFESYDFVCVINLRFRTFPVMLDWSVFFVDFVEVLPYHLVVQQSERPYLLKGQEKMMIKCLGSAIQRAQKLRQPPNFRRKKDKFDVNWNDSVPTINLK